jgi:hypothetical protein
MEQKQEDDMSAAVKIDKSISRLSVITNKVDDVDCIQFLINANSEDPDYLSRLLEQAFTETQIDELAKSHDIFVEIVAEIAALLDDEILFDNLAVPVLPALEHSHVMNIKKLIIFAVLVKRSIQPQLDIEISNANNKKLHLIIEEKKRELNKGFFYKFSDGDLGRIQELINELRENITESNLFEENHKSRLLKRLEAMQGELHKKMGDIDKFWGLVGDAGVVMAKLGKDAKPIVDRIKEIAQLAWTTQANAEELPSNTHNPLLEHDDQ